MNYMTTIISFYITFHLTVDPLKMVLHFLLYSH